MTSFESLKDCRPKRIEDLDFSAFVNLLTGHEWVALDFATGERSILDISQLLPYSPQVLADAYSRLSSLEIVDLGMV